jgi:hypothetical protein
MLCGLQTERPLDLPKPFGAHILIPCALDAGQGATGFKVCPALVHFFLVILLSLSFGMRLFTLCQSMLEAHKQFLDFTGIHR